MKRSRLEHEEGEIVQEHRKHKKDRSPKSRKHEKHHKHSNQKEDKKVLADESENRKRDDKYLQKYKEEKDKLQIISKVPSTLKDLLKESDVVEQPVG